MPKERRVVPMLISAAIFIAMEIAALNMLHNNASLQGIWLSRIAHKVMGVLWGGSESIRHYFSLGRENKALSEENYLLRQSLLRYVSDEQEAVLDAKTAPETPLNGYTYIPAEIVKISRNKQHNYILISKGREDGVRSGSGIITARGAIGIVDTTGRHHSYALSFMNSDISISARLGDEGAVGPLIWDSIHSDGAILKEIPLHFRFSPGDTVYTSGYSSIFPPDIPLGVAGEAKVINGATNEIKVKLLQDFTALRYVTVVYNTAREEMEDLANED